MFGTGAVGLSAIMAAGIAGCERIIGVDLHEGRLDLARELGATHVVDGGTEDAVEVIRAMTHGGVNFSIEATGSPAVLRQAVDALRRSELAE